MSWTMESNPIRAHCLMVGIHWGQHALHDNHYDAAVVPRWGKTVSVELWNSSDSSESFGKHENGNESEFWAGAKVSKNEQLL